jgi:histidinol-phosphate aminotransferase
MNNPVKPQSGLDSIKPYVPGKPIEEVQREYGLTDVIKLASNENPVGPSAKAVTALKDALSQLNFYPDGQCCDLREALALCLEVEPDQIVVGNGVDGIILQTCMAYLDQDDEVIVSQSSFPVYDIFTHVMRARLIKTPLKNYGLDLEAMAAAITPNTKLIFVCNPNNPTGTIVTASEVEAFMHKVPDHILVFFDEAYYEYVDSDEYPDTLHYLREGRKNVLIARTYSKVYGLAGIRLGYGMGDPDLLAPLNRIKEPFSVNSLAQVAGIAALNDHGCLDDSVEDNRTEREFIYQEFDRLDLFYVKSHTNFILVKVGPQSNLIVQGLLKKGVIVRPCGGYDLPEFLRITLGTHDQNERLIRALEQVLFGLRQIQPG